jgi:hypothetical protein
VVLLDFHAFKIQSCALSGTLVTVSITSTEASSVPVSLQGAGVRDQAPEYVRSVSGALHFEALETGGDHVAGERWT